MRPRKKKNADIRIEKASAYLANQPALQKGLWRELFEKPESKLYLEIGCGKGTFACETAKRDPCISMVAMEKVKDVIVTALERANEYELNNLKFILGDASALEDIFADGEVDRIFINFCDPWHKNRHYKRRLTYRGFLEKYKKLLKKGGEIHFKTDNLALFEFSLEEFAAAGLELLSVTRDLEAQNDPSNIVTEYEAAWSAKGFKINRAIVKVN